MTKITWSLGYTLNCGNFESLRVDTSVTDDAREGESAQDASERIYKFVENELANKLRAAREELGNS